MGGQKVEGASYTKHVVFFLLLTVFMYGFAYILVDHNKKVPSRVDTVHAEKQE
jgi:hypothetical protein